MCNVLLGGAIADALGKFAESKSPTYQPLLDWDCKTFIGSEHHGLKSNFFTDDTQFSCAIAKSLIDNGGFNPEDLAQKYVELFTSNTIRGYGKTTLAAIQNLQAGKHWSSSGIAFSIGNGTSMRAAPIGIYFRDNLKELLRTATIDAQITHASDEAVAGSIAIALAAYYAVNHDTDSLLEKIHPHLPDSKVKNTIYSLQALIDSKDISVSNALTFLGTKCDVRQTVPSVIYLFIKMKSYKEAVIAAIKSGFDTDTTASIIGALFAAQNGMKDIPKQWVEQVEDSEKLINLDSQLYNRSSDKFFPR